MSRMYAVIAALLLLLLGLLHVIGQDRGPPGHIHFLNGPADNGITFHSSKG